MPSISEQSLEQQKKRQPTEIEAISWDENLTHTQHTLTPTLALVLAQFVCGFCWYVRVFFSLLIRTWIDGLENGDIKIGKIECAHIQKSVDCTLAAASKITASPTITTRRKVKATLTQQQMTTNVPFLGIKIGYK